jgi:hypothetical protein
LSLFCACEGDGTKTAHEAKSNTRLAVLMRFTWSFLPTVTIDLPNEMASGMPFSDS